MLELLQPFWPFILIPLALGIIRLVIDNGLKETIRILARTVIGIAVAALIFVIVIQFL